MSTPKGKTRSPRRGNQNRRSTTDRVQPTDAPPASASLGSQAQVLWISVGLIAANVLVYAAVHRYEFVNFDDFPYVAQNDMVAAGLTWRGVGWAFTTAHAANWHPLTWLSHMLDVQLYGMQAGGHHVTSLLLHIANTLLLFGVLYRMTGTTGRSGFVAALFAVHPLHVESVAWVAERKDVLSALFWMLTLWSYVSYVRQPRWNRYVLVLVCFALGLMAKPMLVTLPFVLLLLDYWPLERVTRERAVGRDGRVRRVSDQRRVWVSLMREKAPLFALAAASSVVTFVAQRSAGYVVELDLAPPALRVENAVVSYVAYIGKMLWPARLAAFYPWATSIPVWRVVGAALILFAAFAVALRAGRRHPYLLVGWLWYVGTLVPVIGLVQVGGQSMADRYTYIPLIGLWLAVAWGVPDLLTRWRHRRIALATAAGLVLAASMVTARGQVRAWENTYALWQHVVDVTDDNFLAHGYFGDMLASEGKLDEAITHYVEVVRLRPRYVVGILILANALTRAGRLDEAIARYSEALRIRPHSAEAHNNLGVALKQQRKDTEAITHFTEAVRLSPEYPDARRNLAMALGEQGRIDAAISEMLAAVRIKPDQAHWHHDLAVLYQLKGDTKQAVEQLERTLTLDPTDRAARKALRELKARGPQ
jgi:Flp pilus assembly protein TadD